MVETTKPAIDALSSARIARMRRLQQVNFHLFWLSMCGVFGGLILGMVWEHVGTILMMTGFSLLGLLVVEGYVLYPRLICPRCNRRFFLPDGGWHWLARISPTRRRCLHCELSLDETP